MSVSDHREIAFDAASLLSVLAASPRRAKALGLSEPPATDLAFDPGAQTVTFAGEQCRIIHAHQLGEPLIAYCLRAGIKISRHLTRSVRIAPATVVLAFSTEYDVAMLAPRPEEDGAARGSLDARAAMPQEIRRGVAREWR